MIRAIAGDVPQKMPSGTPNSDEIRKPQKMTWIECHRLSGIQIASPRSAGLSKIASQSARATLSGAGR